ncbi:MAG: response regulator, partial [Rhodanobacter sp.]
MSNHKDTNSTILIAEDEAMVAMLLEDLLTDAGHRVVLAETLARALVLVQEEEIDAGILDVTLGREDSFPLADALRGRNIPFLF